MNRSTGRMSFDVRCLLRSSEMFSIHGCAVVRRGKAAGYASGQQVNAAAASQWIFSCCLISGDVVEEVLFGDKYTTA